MVNIVAEKMSEASADKRTAPRRGERFRCSQCGMEIEVTSACSCKDGTHVHFECCDQEMVRV